MLRIFQENVTCAAFLQIFFQKSVPVLIHDEQSQAPVKTLLQIREHFQEPFREGIAADHQDSRLFFGTVGNSMPDPHFS